MSGSPSLQSVAWIKQIVDSGALPEHLAPSRSVEFEDREEFVSLLCAGAPLEPIIFATLLDEETGGVRYRPVAGQDALATILSVIDDGPTALPENVSPTHFWEASILVWQIPGDTAWAPGAEDSHARLIERCRALKSPLRHRDRLTAQAEGFRKLARQASQQGTSVLPEPMRATLIETLDRAAKSYTRIAYLAGQALQESREADE